MAITLRRPQAFTTVNEDQEDFDVLYDERRIGRVYLRSTNDKTAPWCWTLSSAVRPQPTSGRAPTRALAVLTLADTYKALSC
jgi:hypothetical protein